MKKSALSAVVCITTLAGCLAAPTDTPADQRAEASAQAVASTRQGTVFRPISLSMSDRRAIEAEISDIAAARRIRLGDLIAVSHEDAEPVSFGRRSDPERYVCGWFTVQDWEPDAPARMRVDGPVAFYATDSFGSMDWWINTANFTEDDLQASCLADGILLHDGNSDG